MMIAAAVLLPPALLVAGWLATWRVHRSRRRLHFFPATLGAVLLVAAVTYAIPKPPCHTVPTACVDDVSLVGTLDTLTGFATWLILLTITGLTELARHVAYVSRLRRTTDEAAPR